MVIDKDIHPNYVVSGVKYENGLPTWATGKELSTEYRGMRLVRQKMTRYDPTIDKYVSVYKHRE
jgi:hypothetical protein